MLKLLLISLVLTALTVLVHGISALYIVLRLTKIWKKEQYIQRSLGAVLILMRLVSFLLVIHLVEAGLWAMFYYFGGLLDTLETAMYFSLTSFATLGYGDVVLSGPWRLMGPIEASVGILMMGWSTGIIVAAVLRAYTTRLKSN